MEIKVYENGEVLGSVDECDCEMSSWGGARIHDDDNECKIGKVVTGKFKGYTIATDGNETYAY